METPIKLKKPIELLTSIDKMGCEVVNITVNSQVVDIVILDGDAIYKKEFCVFTAEKYTRECLLPGKHDKRTIKQKSIDKKQVKGKFTIMKIEQAGGMII
jgi:hypothetical protein